MIEAMIEERKWNKDRGKERKGNKGSSCFWGRLRKTFVGWMPRHFLQTFMVPRRYNMWSRQDLMYHGWIWLWLVGFPHWADDDLILRYGPKQVSPWGSGPALVSKTNSRVICGGNMNPTLIWPNYRTYSAAMSKMAPIDKFTLHAGMQMQMKTDNESKSDLDESM